MSIALSKSEINSYCGNVIPLYLKSETDISREEINWLCTDDCVHIQEYKNEERHAFTYGIIITLLKEGTANVTCTYRGESYKCTININERKKAKNTDKFNVYPADLHIHTSNDHNKESFPLRETELASDCVKTVYKSGAVEASVLTDHAGVTNAHDFFKCFIADEEVEHDGLIVFPGAEAEVFFVEKDRYGTDLRNSGEIVTINTNYFSNTKTWDDFYSDMSSSPFAIASLAHPLVAGWSTSGIWNFQLYKNSRNPEFKRLVKLIEVGRGDYSVTSMLYHYAYSQALDSGLKVSPCSTSDSHGSYEPCVGKTFIVSPEKTKEMFYDAIINNRVYACESGAVKLAFSINECIMGQTLKLTDTYNFHVEASLLRDEAFSMPEKITVVSDYGKKIYTDSFNGSCDFTIKSNDARYFYIILTDKNSKKTWSAPIWTGREFDDFTFLENLKSLDKKNFTAICEKTNSDAGVIINDNPFEKWCANDKTASIIIDMKKEESVCAVSHMAPAIHRAEAAKNNIDLSKIVTRFASLCRVSTSCDGVNYKLAKEGYIRAFGGDEFIYFDKTKARYIKFEVLSTVGADTERCELKDAKLEIAELTVFTN